MSHPTNMTSRINDIRNMPYGVSREEAASAIVRDIEASGSQSDLPYALFTLVEAYTFGKESERSYVPFTKMIRLWDEHPESFDSFDEHNLFWSFKWMVSELSEYPTVPSAQIEATLDDMAHRFAVAGNGMDGVEHQRFLWSWRREAADLPQAYERWVRTPRDGFSQCEVCDPGDRAAYLFEAGRIAEGIRLVEPILRGNDSCASEPADMLSRLQFAYLDTGSPAEAVRTHRRGVSELSTEFGPRISPISRHIKFLALTRNPDRALLMLKQNQQFLLASEETPSVRLTFLTHVGAALQMILAVDPTDHTVELHNVPATTLRELEQWVKDQAEDLAAQFDANYGGDTARKRLQKAWELTPLPHHLEVSVTTISAVESTALPQDSAHNEEVTRNDAESSSSSTSTARGLRNQASGIARTDPGGAAELYAQAAKTFQSLGYLGDAAACLDDAGTLAQKVGDHQNAAKAFEQAAGMWTAQSENLNGQFSLIYRAIQAYAILDQCDHALSVLRMFMSSKDVATALAGESTVPPKPQSSSGPTSLDDDSIAEQHAEIQEANAKTALQYQAVMRDLEARIQAQSGNFADADTVALDAAEQLANLGLIAEASFSFMLMGRIRQENLQDLEGALWAYESAIEGFTIAHEFEQRDNALGKATGILRSLDRISEADEMAATIGTRR